MPASPAANQPKKKTRFTPPADAPEEGEEPEGEESPRQEAAAKSTGKEEPDFDSWLEGDDF